MMKKFVMVLAVCIMFAAEGIAAEKTISIATSEWLPYCGRFLANYGIEPEIMAAAYQRMGYNTDFNFMAWSRAIKEVKEGKYDAVTSASFTQERARDYLYSKSHMDSPAVFYKRKGSPITWSVLEDLKPYKIGVIKDYSYSPEFDKADFLQKVASKNEVLALKKLILKQADLIVMDRFVGHYTISEKLTAYEKNIPEILYPPLYLDKLHLMVSKKTPDALKKLEAFNAGLKKIIKDGTLKSILVKHGLGK